jgi:MoaA/NifB/PqqE/SkfB family radical SAM enzyme
MKILAKRRVVEKLKRFHTSVRKNNGQIGTSVRGIDFNYDNRCNFRCEHCFTRSALREHRVSRIPLDKVAQIADQADELGIFEFDMQGGELLINPEQLFGFIAAIRPERFYLYLTTNGYLLDLPMAHRLAEAGVDRVSVSVDSLDETVHDKFRGRKGACRRALAALRNVQAAGMTPYLNITVGHYNARSEDVAKLCEFSRSEGYTTLLNVAVPSGCWQHRHEVMIDDGDRRHLGELRKKHGNIIRDTWNAFDRSGEGILGCNAVNRTYITPLGDVLACPYMHIKIGNVYEQSLGEIVEFGFSIPEFREHSPVCLAGEDRDFVERYMTQEMSVFQPQDARRLFNRPAACRLAHPCTARDTDAAYR